MGIVSGLITMIGVWCGHILVRKIDFNAAALRWPVFLFMAAGGGCLLISTFLVHPIFAAGMGICGVILFWDGLELSQQEKRVRIGHAPANPMNPRHRKILESCPDATIVHPFDQVNLKDRDE
jgi:hypothetical protein